MVEWDSHDYTISLTAKEVKELKSILDELFLTFNENSF